MANWLVPDPTVERLDLDEGSWVDVVRGLVPRGDEVHDNLLPRRTGSTARCSATSGGSTRRARWCLRTGTEPAIDEVDAWLRTRYGVPFTAPALALYRNERDSVAFHRAS